MNKVIQTIQEHITDTNVCFVFPSQVAASRWAHKTCTLGIVRSVVEKRFLAWDRFKEAVIREKDSERRPASALIRKLFSESLVNANAKSPFLSSVIQKEFAKDGRIFAPSIARLLPSLFMWEKLTSAASNNQQNNYDAEDNDFLLIKKDYAAFLERYHLFEPSWEEAKLSGGTMRYVIFFPELIEDFSEYDPLLKPPQFTRIKAADVVHAPQNSLHLQLYTSALTELRSAVLELHRLHEEDGIPYEEMALSIPNLPEIEPYLLREFALRHIPIVRRAGKKLGETGVGRLFSLISECAASRFSFASVKALLLNDHIPWKERDKNKRLITFGITYNCVSGYMQDGSFIDIWDEAFKGARHNDRRELEPYYRELKKRILALSKAESFTDVRKQYFALRGEFLDMGKISEDDDAVLSRCIVELSSLIELEELLNDPEFIPSSPFAFFLSCLNDKEYVRTSKNSGINIFKWRVAAAAPFAVHFVLNASQSAASVLYQPMQFLRHDKRKALKLEDTDATGAFFHLCDTGEDRRFSTTVRVSASVHTFSGWAIPHSFFAQGAVIEAPPCPEDSYTCERRFWKERDYANTGAHDLFSQATPLLTIFSIQKNAYTTWNDALTERSNGFSLFNAAFSQIAGKDGLAHISKMVRDAIFDTEGTLTVTPTKDLNDYYFCPLFWLYARIFSAKEFSLEASLLDDTALGLLYHVILEELFTTIRDEDTAFTAAYLPKYKRWALEITIDAIKQHPAFKGPLAVPLVLPQASGMAKKIAGLLDKEAELFDGYTIVALERSVSVKTGNVFIKGVIDRVSCSPDGAPIIIDYKTSYIPVQISIDDIQEMPLTEFQMPVYIKLYEALSESKVEGAFFYSINNREIKAAVTNNTSARTKAPTREEYAPFLEAAERHMDEFASKVENLDFMPHEINVGNCTSCRYKTVCRSVYSLNNALLPKKEIENKER